MRATLRMLLYLTALVVGGAALAVTVRPEWSEFVQKVFQTPEGRLTVGIIGSILLICPLSIFLRWWRVHRHAREISYATDTGRVSVSLVAIEEALTRALENENCVKKATVRIHEDRVKRQVIIEAILTLWEVPNVTERNRTCGQILRRRFNELMPEQTAVQVNLTVHRLDQRRHEQRKHEQPPAPVADAPAITDVSSQTATATQFGDLGIEPTGGLGLPRKDTAGAGVVPIDPYDHLGSEDDLYVGPSYPVESDDDDSGEQAAVGKQGKSGAKKKS
jgi:hypothetical protein